MSKSEKSSANMRAAVIGGALAALWAGGVTGTLRAVDPWMSGTMDVALLSMMQESQPVTESPSVPVSPSDPSEGNRATAGGEANAIDAPVSNLPPINVDELAPRAIEALSATLADRTLDGDRRESAARRLAAVGSAEARLPLLRTLTDPGDPVGRLSVARALADVPANPEFVDALFVLLDESTPRGLLEAAADAIAANKQNPAVVTRLIALTPPESPETVRRAAIRALGTLSDRRGAVRLVELLSDASPVIQQASIDALNDLTGQNIFSPAEWQAWWSVRAAQTDEQFRLEALAIRSARLDRQSRANQSAGAEIRTQLSQQLAAAPREQRGPILETALLSPRPSLRAAAAFLIAERAKTGDVPAPLRSRLADFAGDSEVEVRLQIAQALTFINDRAAFDQLTQQIMVERDARVRSSLTDALGRMRDPRAIPLLSRLLDDPSPPVVMAATGAIAELGDTLAGSDAVTARSLAERLRLLFLERFPAGQTSPLRLSLLRALTSLEQPSLLPLFQRLLAADAAEPSAVRQLALMGIAAIGDPSTSDLVVDLLNDESTEVRVEAVRALAKTSNSFIYGETLFRRLSPQVEPDERVRTEVWRTLVTLLPLARQEELMLWPDRFASEPARRVDVLEALVELDQKPGNRIDYLPDHLTSLGETQLSLGRYQDAMRSFQRALPLATNAPTLTIRLIELSLDARLRARDWRGAVTFAAQVLGERGNEFQTTVGPKLKQAAEQLAADNTQPEEARRFIEQALAMTPPLAAQYQGQLRDIQKSLADRDNQRNNAAPDSLHAPESAPTLAPNHARTTPEPVASAR